MASTRRITLIAGMAALGVLVLPSAASAAVSCTFNTGTGALDVSVTNGTTSVVLSHAASPGSELLVNGSSACAGGTPTDTTTSVITVDENGSNQSTNLTVNFADGRLAPGAGGETSTPEIEISYLADSTGSDVFNVNGSTESADQTFQFGTTGAGVMSGNLNGDADADDVTLTGVDRLSATPGTGNDTFTGDGTGSGTFTGPVPVPMNANGSQGNDTFATGTGSNSILTGGLGNDSLTGGSSTDTLDMADGNDTMNGGGGIDYASYEGDASVTGVTLDLSQTGPQNTGDQGTDQVTNVENAVGSNGDDHLTGTSGPNLLYGGNVTLDNGNDVLIGGGGSDDLIGWKGNDVLVGGQGDDDLQGDSGTDTASYALGSTGPVTMDLGLAKTGVPQNTGGAGIDTLVDGGAPGDPDTNHEVENLIGSPFGGDLLTGNTGPNQIDAYDGHADTVDCVASGDGDVAIADEIGVDSLTLCESTDNSPQTSIVSGPAAGATVATRTPTYGLSADEPSTFQIKVDSGSFQACAASCKVPSLADGSHTLAFRAIDTDENGHADLTPATRTVKVAIPVATPLDKTAPETTIDSHPKPKTKRRRATFSFGSSEAGSSFLCSYDGKAYAPCSSPFATPKLKKGKHRFDVLATDAAGNRDQSAATFFWKVVKRRKR
jgi:hypothetical protein